MKVVLTCIVFPEPRGGILPGPERLTHRLASALRGKRVDVSIVTSFWNGGNGTDVVDGITVHRVLSSGDLAGAFGRAFGMHYVSWARKVLDATKALRGTDVIHALSPLSSARAFKRGGLPMVATFQHLARIRSAADLLSVPWQHMLEQWTYRHAALVTTPSRASSEDLRRRFHVPGERIRVVPYGVDVPRNSPLPDRDPRRILCVGILERRKGIDLLIRAAAQLLPDYPDLSLTLVGRGPQRSELEALAMKLGLGKRVNFLGYVRDDELQDLYARSGLFAFPSLQEGFGLVLLEAMAHGLPVVTSATASIRETVGEYAIGVTPGGVESLASGLRRVFDDAALARYLSTRGREHVMANYSWDATAERFLDIYQTVASGWSV